MYNLRMYLASIYNSIFNVIDYEMYHKAIQARENLPDIVFQHSSDITSSGYMQYYLQQTFRSK
jgi:hypothetical protein